MNDGRFTIEDCQACQYQQTQTGKKRCGDHRDTDLAGPVNRISQLPLGYSHRTQIRQGPWLPVRHEAARDRVQGLDVGIAVPAAC
jgi:hypothetical protein